MLQRSIFPLSNLNVFFKESLIALLITFAINFLTVSMLTHYGVDLQKSPVTSNIAKLFPNINWYFYIIIFVPVIEEFSFRLYLRPKREYIYVSILLMVLLYSDRIICYIDVSIFYYTLILITVLIISFIVLRVISPMVTIFSEKRSYLFYSTSVLAFWIFHFTYQHLFENLHWVIIKLLPQLFAGVVLVRFRVRYGIIFSILFHSFYNGLLALGLYMIT